MAFQYANVNSGGMSTHYHARSLKKLLKKIRKEFFIQLISNVNILIEDITVIRNMSKYFSASSSVLFEECITENGGLI